VVVALDNKALLVNGGYVDLQEKDHFKIKNRQITLEAWIYQEKPLPVWSGIFSCVWDSGSDEGGYALMSDAYAARHVTEIMLAGIESSNTGQVIELKTRVDVQ
jgi:hypothetical protein